MKVSTSDNALYQQSIHGCLVQPGCRGVSAQELFGRHLHVVAERTVRHHRQAPERMGRDKPKLYSREAYQSRTPLFRWRIQNSKELASGTFTARLIAFLATFGIRAEADERQALTIDGLKISGSAQSIHKGRILHHATLLFSTDLYRLTTALKNTERKPEKKEMKPAPFYVKSVRSPVTNICTYTRKAVSIGEFRDALLNYFTENKTDTRPYSFTEDDLNAIRSLRDNKYATSAWNFNIRT